MSSSKIHKARKTLSHAELIKGESPFTSKTWLQNVRARQAKQDRKVAAARTRKRLKLKLAQDKHKRRMSIFAR